MRNCPKRTDLSSNGPKMTILAWFFKFPWKCIFNRDKMCNEPKRADYAKRDQKYTVLLDFPRIDLEKQFFPTLRGLIWERTFFNWRFLFSTCSWLKNAVLATIKRLTTLKTEGKSRVSFGTSNWLTNALSATIKSLICVETAWKWPFSQALKFDS